MKAALAVPVVTPGVEGDLAAMEAWAHRSADGDADLNLFPEAAPTGFIVQDDPARDRPLGPAIERLASAARESGICVSTGLLERKVREPCSPPYHGAMVD